MPFSPSCSHLSFLPKSCFHSCTLLLMLTLCGPFLIRKQKQRNTLIDFLPYCNPGLLRIWRSVIYSALLLPTFPQMTLLDGEPRALPPDSEMKRMPGTALFPRCAPVIPVLWCNCHAVSHFVLFFNKLIGCSLKCQVTVLNRQSKMVICMRRIGRIPRNVQSTAMGGLCPREHLCQLFILP